VPLSMRLRGKITSEEMVTWVSNGVTLIDHVVPIEFVMHKSARITIGDHTFVNYGSSISAHERVTIGR
jgi:hypothetical protein